MISNLLEKSLGNSDQSVLECQSNIFRIIVGQLRSFFVWKNCRATLIKYFQKNRRVTLIKYFQKNRPVTLIKYFQKNRRVTLIKYFQKNRRATLINTCLGMKDKPHFIDFDFYREIDSSFYLIFILFDIFRPDLDL